jgi:FkbM family methyltransferase
MFKQSAKCLVGSVPTKLEDRLLGSPWFPLLRTFRLRRHWLYDVCRFAGTRSLQTACDVGANVGRYSCWMARFLPEATIFAFEPVKETFRQLQATSARFHGKIKPHCLALGSARETRHIVLNDYSETNHLIKGEGQLPAGGEMSAQTVKVDRLDNFCREHGISRIDLLKTDTEGFDKEVLVGAGDLIEQRPIPFIYAEVGFTDRDDAHTRFQELLVLLEPRGYALKGFYDQWAENEAHEMFCNALFIHPEEIKRRFCGR